MDDNYREDHPCNNCGQAEYCDNWEARYCCDLCEYLGLEDCENCNSMDI